MSALALHVVTMGVSGCGKSTVAPLLAQKLGGIFIDGATLEPLGPDERGAGFDIAEPPAACAAAAAAWLRSLVRGGL